MTTILLDFENQTINADKRTTVSYHDVPTTSEEDTCKINKHGSKYITAAGDCNVIDAFEDAYPNLHGVYTKTPTNTTILVVSKAAKGLWVKQFEFKQGKTNATFVDWFLNNMPTKAYVPELVRDEVITTGCMSIGSGSTIAKVLFDLGFTVQEVYDTVSQYDVGTNNIITTRGFK